MNTIETEEKKFFLILASSSDLRENRSGAKLNEQRDIVQLRCAPVQVQKKWFNLVYVAKLIYS